MKEHHYWVYILASRSHNFYVGMTNDIERRVREHRTKAIDGFSTRYNINRLVWYERFHYVRNAIAREKQIKSWRREKKIALIEKANPTWQDLSEEWGKPVPPLAQAADPSTPVAATSARDDNS
ncbi:MAG TPA: GIY-YIG nuclease family protein [Bryocella sp.]|nr:GIY-YIG nuclease family protein [Bryocella sp.]